ncbi:glycoside hydrolase family 20 zincin-like fold domain-containing protein [Clostridiaceae bacterium M8S5]|nr:glycoside hydrolase family 20 zincin-like fold domain-containing protein [Clostridiaceae bacterium M8S5]
MYILPVPSYLEIKEGYFNIDYETRINVPASHIGIVLGKTLSKYIKQNTGMVVSIGSCLSSNQIVFTYGNEISEEAYEIEINKDNILIKASTDSGLFYGMQTLKQIIKQGKRHLPALHIKDEPSFKNRGFYHDVTRGKVPTLDSLKELADIASSYKLNQLQLYIEHTFLFRGHSEVSTITDPLTAEEIMELDEYCSERFIELVPSIATFGHLYELLRSETYSHLCELENIKDVPYSWVDRMGHHTLNISNDESIEFVKDMIDEFAVLFRTDKFNICADETFDLGKGKNKELAEKVGTSKLYVDFLCKIVNHLKVRHNKKVMFWGDIIIKHPEHIDDLPKDLICLNWWYWLNYEEKKVKIIKDSGFQQYVCPGVHGWDRLMNDFKLSYDNIKMMTNYGRKYEAIGMLNTDWGDYGHWNFFASSIPGLIYGAQFSWSSSEISYEDINMGIDILQFGVKNDCIMEMLDEVAKAHHMTLLPLVQWIQARETKYIKLVTNDTEILLQDIENLKKISDKLLDIMANVDIDQRDYMHAFYVATKGIIIFNNLVPYIKRWALKEQMSTEGFMMQAECATSLEIWLQNLKEIWLKRNKPSELYRIVEFVRELCKELRRDNLKA